jgi:hypothetical protein
MGRKQSNGEGTIYKRADRRWCAQVIMPDGKRKTIYGKSRADVGKRKISLLKSKHDGLPAYDEKVTVEQYFKRWLADNAPPTLRKRTHQRYEQYVRSHIVPQIGKVRLARLTPAHLQDL